MRILFGPAHDGCHISPDEPGAYEWWYFDALSDDGRYALVVIYFLGSPMTPYYKAVVDGKNPIPRDWCGVFISLHEKVGSRFRERAYAYNLYNAGDFAVKRPAARIGESSFDSTCAGEMWTWDLHVSERNLWHGTTKADFTFTSHRMPLDASKTVAVTEPHTWVCVAPVCQVEGSFLLANGETIAFTGDGYHDHNFGQLPYDDTEIWYWGRAHLHDKAGTLSTVVFYDTHEPAGDTTKTWLVFNASGAQTESHTAYAKAAGGESRFAYGLRHQSEVVFTKPKKLTVPLVGDGILSSGPFYRRITAPFTLFQNDEALTGEGIAEIFRPARLCGPIASRAIWSRIRRRR